MLNHETRSAILRLQEQGHGTKFIARAVGVARDSVKRVLASGSSDVPDIERADQLGIHAEKIKKLEVASI